MNDKGFSLIELVIVIVIMGIASAGLMSVFSTGMKKSADPLLENQAVQLAQEKLEIVVGDRMNPARGFAYIASANYPNENIDLDLVNPSPIFSRTVATCCVTAADLNAISPCTAPPCASGYTHVTISVSQAVIGSVTLASLVTDY